MTQKKGKKDHAIIKKIKECRNDGKIERKKMKELRMEEQK